MLNSNALITVDTYSRAARIPNPSQDPMDKAEVEFAINSASDYMETETGRTFLSGSIETETFIGQGCNVRYEYVHKSYTLQQVPITNIPSIPVLYKDNNGTWDAVDATTYTYDAVTGELYFHSTNGSFFLEGVRYKVDYYSGYNGRANIPGDLQMGTALMTKFIMMSIKHAGVTQTTFGEKTHSYDLSEIPILVQKVVKKYTR
ncbi:hypothetical protein LCGC14_1034100 [marine sediment metagenome]|uniref:Uncharacterized protein n=1 Tax=marine sediment metagenome TaxID=412755 RepID=A0A0F9QZR5_9ZZZZ